MTTTKSDRLEELRRNYSGVHVATVKEREFLEGLLTLTCEAIEEMDEECERLLAEVERLNAENEKLREHNLHVKLMGF